MVKFGGAALFNRRTTQCHPPHFSTAVYTLADEALEDALYDSQAMRTFAGIDLTFRHAYAYNQSNEVGH